MVITSRDNDLIKHVRKLKEKKYREECKEFIIEGAKMIEEAIKEKANINTIIICDDCKTGEDCISNELMYEIAKFDCVYTDEKVFTSITDVVNPQGVMAIVEKPECEETNIDYKQDMFLILDNIQDPGNMGTILRTVDSLNIKQIIISKDTTDIYSPKVVRATMGAIFRVNVIEVDSIVKLIKDMKKHKINVYATDLRTDQNMYDIDYKKSAIIIGNEANGINEEILKAVDKKIRIPMVGKTESLNAAVATGIILYEAFREKLK